jgi:hypothetical protein
MLRMKQVPYFAGLRGLGSSALPVGGAGAFTEEALQAKLAELAQVRSEIATVEAEIESVRTGRPVAPKVAPGPGRIEVPAAPPSRPSLPGGTVELPVVGRVPTLVLVAVAAGFLFIRRGR